MDATAWVGIDAGKRSHWAHALDASGETLLSRKIENTESDLSALIDEALALSLELTWATDQPGGAASLLLALLWERGQRVIYLPGIVVDRARDAYRGESKTDAKDAYIIADQARMRRDLGQLDPGEEALAELSLLVCRRRDLVADKTRAVNRLRDTLLSFSPALERTLDVGAKGALILLSRYQSPRALRRAGEGRIAAYLKRSGVKGATSLAKKALGAAKAQSATLPAEEIAATIVADLAKEILALKEQIVRLDAELGSRFFSHPRAKILASLPGMGPLLGAEFLVATGDIGAFTTADSLAAYAGLVPAARDSGKRVDNHRRTRGGNKMLKRVFYLSAFASLRTTTSSRTFYERKRKEGKRHHQAVIALARRRVNVLWAMLRDGTTFEPPLGA